MYRYSKLWIQPKECKSDGLGEDRSRRNCGGRPQTLSRIPEPITKIRKYEGPSRYRKLMTVMEGDEMYKPVPKDRRTEIQRVRLFQRVSDTGFMAQVLACVQDPDSSKESIQAAHTKRRYGLLVRKDEPLPEGKRTEFKLMCSVCDYPYRLEKRRPPPHLARLEYASLPRGSWSSSPQTSRRATAWDARVALAIGPLSKRVIQKVGARRSSTELYKHIINLDAVSHK